MVKIRPAKIKDAREIAELNLKLMKHVGKYDAIFKIKKNSLGIMEDWHKKCIYNPRRKVLVAEYDGKIVGYAKASISKRPKIYEVEEVGFINDVYVLPTYRQQGISKKFTEIIFEWLKSKGMTYVNLFAVSKNEVAIKVWKKFKFKEFLKEKYRKL